MRYTKKNTNGYTQNCDNIYSLITFTNFANLSRRYRAVEANLTIALYKPFIKMIFVQVPELRAAKIWSKEMHLFRNSL